MRFAHTNIIARDWRKLSLFYERVFDCKPVPPKRKQSGPWLSRGTGVPNASLEGNHLALPGYENGPTLEIYQYKTALDSGLKMPNSTGLGHLAFEVTQIESVIQRLLDHGGSLLGEMTKQHIQDVGIITFVYARDPEGNILELQSWEKP